MLGRCLGRMEPLLVLELAACPGSLGQTQGLWGVRGVDPPWWFDVG